ncbi:type I-E CRISPR-associated protein Cas6/Cse3/CasE [Glycomyces sp. L485]|uniref:type I-E CRISPR-associated protein Cas6/Cse3/CasE n=1 Tax=Glycomyces sp. L485 TaxID=2909235 RepID=UPI001F4AEDA3|nr:type I-E CRISPR-associated protein Cas6/Cse3/CasE [Glycomyces sp. L485]MCH7230515.1 type I-E CRISPR-associated protein Cas6/Cse3/CasE [Glycomyces sp. L485]
MYLTRFRFNTARMGARRVMASPQKLHAAVLHGFPEPERLATDEARILWRLDRDSRHSALLYIASPEEPDLTHLVEQAGWPVRGFAEGWDTRPYDKLLETLGAGQQWAFRLTANPVHHVHLRPGKQGQRLAHVTVAQQLQWLLDRCSARGFSIADKHDGDLNVEVRDRSWLRFSKDGGPPVDLRVATFEGVLQIEDPDTMRRTLVTGIGKAKAYGCGMLTLAPVAGSMS